MNENDNDLPLDASEDFGKTTCPHCQNQEWFIYQFILGQLLVAICTKCAEKYGIGDAYKFIV